jgi:hypothetical protein
MRSTTLGLSTKRLSLSVLASPSELCVSVPHVVRMTVCRLIPIRPPVALTAALLLLVAALPVVLSAADGDAWDWLPVVAYEREAVDLTLRPAGGAAAWTAHSEPAARLDVVAGETLRVGIPADAAPAQVVLTGAGRSRTIACIAPGAGAGLRLDDEGRLRRQDAWAVLRLPRVEAVADRRWQGLISGGEAQPIRCDLVLRAGPIPAGACGLAGLIVAAQQPVQGRAVLVELDAATGGWTHRAWRQTLAWLAADLAARGATRIVLVEPAIAAPLESQAAPLRLQTRDVAAAYRLTSIDTTGLGTLAHWQTAPGILGTSLNTDGQAARAALLAAWLPAGG